MNNNTFLVLEDGTEYKGTGFGADAPSASQLKKTDGESLKFAGELVFNTGMTGYHEILTDPSYTGQIVLMTYPHIGNYGCDPEWNENGPEVPSRKTVKVSGFVVRSVYTGPVPKGRITLDDFLKQNNICAISDVDTRRLTLRLRDLGSCNAVLVSGSGEKALDESEKKAVLAYFNTIPKMEGLNLVPFVGTDKKVDAKREGVKKVALLDCGLKANIIREFNKLDVDVVVLPSDASESDILDTGADGVMFSNGPGDPGVLEDQTKVAQSLIGKTPVIGICLGHQLISQALGAETFKMKFGHHGCNHPVLDKKTGRVFVTSQNHGFAVNPESLPKGAEIRFVNANDQSVEGLEFPDKKVLCVQFHPEASPGPVDSAWIFKSFVELLEDK